MAVTAHNQSLLHAKPQQRCRGAPALTPRGRRRREDILGEFMEYVARSPVMSESSSVFVAYLGILTALAQGETGAEVRALVSCGTEQNGSPLCLTVW